jgi:hypothetical protein
MHALPNAPGCHLPTLSVDRYHPYIGMRANEVNVLTCEFEPDLIHEIRRSIRLERPGGYRKMLQQPNLEPQLFVGFGQLLCSFPDVPLDFIFNPLLVIEAPFLNPIKSLNCSFDLKCLPKRGNSNHASDPLSNREVFPTCRCRFPSTGTAVHRWRRLHIPAIRMTPSSIANTPTTNGRVN